MECRPATSQTIAHFRHTLEVFISLFRNSLPALRAVWVSFARLDENREFPSWIHAILSSDRPIPGILKTTVLECDYRSPNLKCCKNVVGTSEEVAGSAQRLPELLPELAKLVIRLGWCEHPQRHAAYIWNVLPGMRNVLRFEYRAGFGNWKPYTLVPADVPLLLPQDIDSESDSDSDSDSYLFALGLGLGLGLAHVLTLCFISLDPRLLPLWA